MSDPLDLASEFPPATHDAWRTLVDGVLKGRPFETLVSKTHDGLRFAPLYAKSDAQPVAGRAPGAPWQLMQRVDHPEPAAANEEALHDLENGATGLSLVFPGAAGSFGYGIDAGALPRILEGVHLDAGMALELELAGKPAAALEPLAALVQTRGYDPAALDIRFGIDPLGAYAQAGTGAQDWPEAAKDFCATIRAMAARGFKGPFAAADGRIIHAAGGSEAQELAFVLAAGIAYLRALESGGIAIGAARKMIFFRLAPDADQFLTTAKFRALRKLWARAESACGLSPHPAFVAAETAWRMMTRRDPHVNMLRSTVAVFAAATGGADAITVLPFTAALGLPDRFARRVARNTQLILAEETHLVKVADPAAGSGAIDAMTDGLCGAAWTLFQQIEREGGLAAALAGGLIHREVARVRAARERAIATRRDGIIGTSEFPYLAEIPPAVLDVPPRVLAPAAATHAAPLLPMRLAEPFEALRDASDAVLAKTGTRPKVFLANLGMPSTFLARASFAKNFFEAGGIEAVANEGFVSPLPLGEVKTDLSALAAAFRASGAGLACLCSSDAVYASEAEVAARALASAGARHIYLAGRPGELEPSLRAAGVGEFIHAGGDMLEALQAAHDKLAGAGLRPGLSKSGSLARGKT